MTTECRALEVAKTVISAEDPEPFEWTGHGELGADFTPLQRSWFAPPRTTASIRRYQFEDVILDPSWGVLFHDRQPIGESKYLAFPEQLENCHVVDDLVTNQPSDRLFVLGRNNGHKNYYHWLAQCLPAIECGLRHVDPDKIALVIPELSSWQERTLELLGFGQVPRLTLDPARQYRFPRLEFAEYLNGRSSFEVSRVLGDLCQRMSRSAGGPDQPSGEVIYVARTDSHQRTALNEAELIDCLRERGVQIIIPSSLSLDQQIKAFRNARLIIGPHGAGLSNVGFCAPGATLYEFFPGHYVNPCTFKIALATGLNYYADCFGTEPDSDDWVHSIPWLIDITCVLNRIDQIRSSTDRGVSRNLAASSSLRDVMMDFESLGDNCELGLVQRQVGAEPISLLRFASPAIPIEQRPDFISDAIARKFAGLGAAGTISLELAGQPGRREYLLRESCYHLLYHTFKLEGEIDPDEFTLKETRRLEFLRQKLMSDLAQGEKIWVWKSNVDIPLRQIEKLLAVLRSFGPNTLLWVVRSDEQHPPGSVELIASDLMKGYVERFAPYDRATDISFEPWFTMCLNARELWKKSDCEASSPPPVRLDESDQSPPANAQSNPGSPAWPLFSEQQCAAMARALGPCAGSITLSVDTVNAPESDTLTEQIASVFRGIGVAVTIRRDVDDQHLRSGVQLTLPVLPTSESRLIYDAFTKSGLTPDICLDVDHRLGTSASVTISRNPALK